MAEKLREIIEPNNKRASITAVLALSTVLSGCTGGSEFKGEATMPFINNGNVSVCPVDLECAEGKNFNTGLKNCIDFSRCDPPMEK